MDDFQEYPRWVYTAAGAFVVQNAEEHAKHPDASLVPLGTEPVAEPVIEPVEGATKEDVCAQLDALGIAYDKRLGLDKLQKLIP